MLTGFAIDLGSPFFWIFLATAVVLLLPVTDVIWRRRLLAAVNLGFIGAVAGLAAAISAGAFAFLLHGASAVRTRAWKRLALLAAASGVAGLFLMHKLRPSHFADGAPGSIWRVLSLVSFSYVALRAVELLRAGAEGDPAVATSGWMDATNYLFPFHMLAAGPIQSWHDFAYHRGVPPRLMPTGTLAAIERIVSGMFKKFVLARVIEVTFLTGFRAPWPYLLLELQVYYVWVYLDFSAYSDIAVGAGRLIGVHTPENFRHPLVARNIVEFWERWHISLSLFIRRNIFIPVQLGLMRRAPKTSPVAIYAIAISVTFIGAGLWHGISLRYVIWGAAHAVALICCVASNRAMMKRWGESGVAAYRANRVARVAATVLTFEFVALSLAFIAHPATAFLG